MINLNIQKTYSNAYGKNLFVQTTSEKISNTKQDTVSFNGWFSSKPPKILVSQEVYNEICQLAEKNDGKWDTHFMICLKKLCEEYGDTYNNFENLLIYVREISEESQPKFRSILIQARDTTNDVSLKKSFQMLLNDFAKGPLK